MPYKQFIEKCVNGRIFAILSKLYLPKYHVREAYPQERVFDSVFVFREFHLTECYLSEVF